MKEAASGTRPGTGDPDPDLNKIADELYRVRPDAFAAARDEAVRTARAAGRQPLARELARLRKPTQSAWLVNLLWRDSRSVIEQFLQLAEELSVAQSQASGPELHRLMAVRRELEAALVRGARGLAEKEGVSVTAAMEREAQETLSAALARPEVANEIRTGRLVKPAAYAGFGAVLAATPGTPARAPAEDRQPTQLDAARARKHEERGAAAPKTDPRQARARERLEAAERALEDARAVLEAASGGLAEYRGAWESAEARHSLLRAQQDEVQTELRQVQQRLRELQERLRTVQADVFTAEQALSAAATRKAQAEKAHEAAERTLARAEKEYTDAGG